jgi:hypothetical protein
MVRMPKRGLFKKLLTDLNTTTETEIGSKAVSLTKLADAVVARLIPTSGIANANVATDAAIAKTKLAALDIGDADIAAAGLSKGVDGTGEGYTIALVTAAFGDPATLADGQTFIYRDTSGNKTYSVSVYDGVFYGVEKAAVPSGE